MANKKGRIDGVIKRIFIEMGVLVSVLAVLLIVIISLWSREPGTQDGGKSTEQTTGSTGQSTQTTTTPTTVPPDTSPEGLLNAFMKEHDLTRDDYGDNVLEVYEKFPEVQDFILQIPLEKGREPVNDISWADRSEGVPLLLQYDERWGYTEYGSSVCGLSGCGPTCLSMVAYYWTGNTQYTPVYMMQFAKDNGHVGKSGGTNWTLFQQGPASFGLRVKEVMLHEPAIAEYLKKGIPVVINVGEGTFTLHGHYMVLVGYEDGMFKLNDPFSQANSDRLWTYEELTYNDQIKNLWAISMPETT